ncbi:MAG: isocitrate/isopropylmalate family dehydrogenase [Thermodesulfobacteriota bacterium]
MGEKYEIDLIPGDGTGPEVVAEGIKVLKAVTQKTGVQCNLTH